MVFPKTLTVGVEPYVPVENAIGELVPGWGPVTEVDVYGFGDPGGDKEIRATNTGLEIDGDLYVDEWVFPPKSKVSVVGVEYEQIGWPENYNLGPFGWAPGLRVNLKRIEG